VLQDTAQPLQLTVAELLRHWARLYPRARDPREVAELVGLQDRFRARVSTLSGGQRRRLDVGLGIIGRPELLFLDEPTTGFDPTARLHFWDVVGSLRDEGTTILLTTHYLDEAARLADRVAVVAQGRLVAAGTPGDLGGALRQVSTVRWRDAAGVPRERRTSSPTAVLRDLLDTATGEVEGLQVRPTSLEEVYLQLVGHPVVEGETAA
jgi:ABC-2 type transport system ATP-binding protein